MFVCFCFGLVGEMGIGEMRFDETGIGEMGIGGTGIGEMGIDETGIGETVPLRQLHGQTATGLKRHSNRGTSSLLSNSRVVRLRIRRKRP